MKRRKEKKVRKKRRWLRILFLLFLLFVFIGFIVMFLGAYVFDTRVRTVIIHNNTIYNDQQILEMADLIDYPNFFLTNTSKIKKDLEKDDFINDVKIKRDTKLRLHVYIEEEKPLFIREDTNKIVFDKNKEINNDGKYLDVPYLINYVPNTKYDSFIEKIKQIDYDLLKKISQIKYDPSKYDEDRFLLYMNDSNRVYVNLPKFKAFNKYDEMVTKFEGKTGTLYLDSGNYFEIDK